MKYKKRNLYTDANGRNIILRFENTDDQLRLDLHAVLNFIYDKCDNIDFNNENDTHNNGGVDHMYSNISTFNEDLYGDIEEDYDMDIYDCLCDTCFNNLNKQNKIEWKVKNEEEDLERALDFKINKWGFETKNN